MKKYIDRFKKNNKAEKTSNIFFIIFITLGIASVIHMITKGEIGFTIQAILYALVLFVPYLLQKLFKIKFSPFLKIFLYFYIFGGATLGTIYNFHGMGIHWDTIMHVLTGFLAMGICIAIFRDMVKIDIIKKSPMYIVLSAFCLSVTIGSVWEFYEYGADKIFKTDMHDDVLINEIHSYLLQEENMRKTVSITGIEKTVLYDKDDNLLFVIKGGYLDVGFNDVMKDMIVHAGASLVFAIMIFPYYKNNKLRFMRHFVPERAESGK